MTGLSAAGEASVLTPLTTTAYVSLHIADPGTTGANEVSGGAYARQGPIAFANAGAEPTVASNSAILTFPAVRDLDGGDRRDVPGLGRADPGQADQHWRHGAVSRRGADDHGAMTCRQIMARAIGA
jgi:hypothetical protein